MKQDIWKQDRVVWLLSFGVMAGIIAGTVCYLLRPDAMRASPAQVCLTCVFLLLADAILCMAVVLRRSLRRSLYSHGNILLIAGILYAGLQFGALLEYFLSCIGAPERLSVDTVLLTVAGFPRHFAAVALPVLCLLCSLVIVSNLALIRHEGFRVTNLMGALLGLAYVGGTFAVFALAEHTLGHLPEGHLFNALHTGVFLLLTLLLCWLESVLAGFIVMSWLAARHIPAYDKDFIIIPGCSISRTGGLLPLLKGRVNRAVRFAWDQEIATGKPVHYVPSGGQGPDEVMSEGSAMELYLLTHGAEDWEVFPEKNSRNTEENMLFSKAVIESLKPGARVAFATTNYHVFRSGLLAREAGMEAEGIASSTKWYFWPNGLVREFFALVVKFRAQHVLVTTALTAACAVMTIVLYSRGL